MCDVRDMRDPQKLWETIVVHLNDARTRNPTYTASRAAGMATWENVPVVAEADGVYVGPLQRYPRA